MSELFKSANTLLVSAIAKLDAVQHADQLPNFTQEMFEYQKQFIFFGFGMPYPVGIGYPNFFVRGTLPCKKVLISLAWLGDDVRAAFSAGEKERLLAQLRQKVIQLNSMLPVCTAAAPHYYGTVKSEDNDVISGDFDRASMTTSGVGSPYFSVFIKTTLRTDEVQLLGLAPADSVELQTQALAQINTHCQGGAVQSLVEPVPIAARAQLHWRDGIVLVRGRRGRLGVSGSSGHNIDSPYAAGEVWCGSKRVNIGEALLRAGFATLDFAQVLSPRVTSAKGSSITVDNYPEYFAALNEARQARRGVWALVKNM